MHANDPRRDSLRIKTDWHHGARDSRRRVVWLVILFALALGAAAAIG